MRPLLKYLPLKSYNPSTSTTATLTAVSQYLQTPKNIGQRLSLLALFIAPILAPLQVRAALPQEIESALARAHLSTADISIVIIPVGDKNASRLPSPIQVIDSKKTVNQLQPASSDSININGKRTHASTMKLVPSFIALDTLGADFVWHTRVYHTGIILGNTLLGDLVIQGSGDPFDCRLC